MARNSRSRNALQCCPRAGRPIRPAAIATAILAATLCATLLPAPAHAGEGHFGFVREVPVHEPGTREYEQWVTWETHKGSDSEFDSFSFRHELEFGVTENFQFAMYVSDWKYEDGISVTDDGAEWNNVSFEGIYQFTDPTADPLGVSAYGEVKIGDEKFVLEPKLLLQKNIGRWIFAYNFVFEAEWEGEEFSETKAEFKNIFGASYQINQNWTVGAELINEHEYEHYEDWSRGLLYIGPNVGYRSGNWWVALTPTFQVTDVDSAADFQTRLLFGIDF